MSESDDHELLAKFARGESEPAFAMLVARYVNLVYSTAHRFTGNAHHAQEITQAVFIILARKAGKLSSRVVLSGWLYQVARLTSANFMKGEIRRQRREQEAYMQSALNEPARDHWHEIAPLLDEAMGKLGKTDRDAVVLRYFENKSAAEIGAALRLNEETARKRVNRALEKLHHFFHKRGISSTTAIIAGAISTNSVQAAPLGLAKFIAPVAIAKGSIATTATLTLVKGTLNRMMWSHFKIVAGLGTAIILAAAGTATLTAQLATEDSAKASISYKMLDDLSQFTDSVDQKKLVMRQLITSKNKLVRPQDIHFTIQTKSQGTLSVKLGERGQVLDFPHDDTLRRENPSVVSNQPKGTLNTSIWCYVPMPDALNFSYSRLGDAVAEANKAVETAKRMVKDGYSGTAPPFPDKISGVVFVFPKASAGKAKITIASPKGTREYIANHAGEAQVNVDTTPLRDNPTVTLTEKPRWVALAMNGR